MRTHRPERRAPPPTDGRIVGGSSPRYLPRSVFPPVEIAVAWIVTFVAAALQGSLGFGFNVISVPILTLVDPALTPIPQLFISLPIALAALWRERDHLDTTGIGWIVAGRIPGALVGAWLLTLLDERVLSAIIALVVLGAVVSISRGIVIRLDRRNRILAGLVSGFSGTTAAIGGPPLALLYREADGGVVRSSLGAIFSIGVAINLSSLAATGAITATDVTTAALLLPPMVAGFAVSGRLLHRLESGVLRTGILVVSAMAATGLLVKAIGG